MGTLWLMNKIIARWQHNWLKNKIKLIIIYRIKVRRKSSDMYLITSKKNRSQHDWLEKSGNMARRQEKHWERYNKEKDRVHVVEFLYETLLAIKLINSLSRISMEVTLVKIVGLLLATIFLDQISNPKLSRSIDAAIRIFTVNLLHTAP
jgi:hypothetical protein